MQGLQLCKRQQDERLGWRETVCAWVLHAGKGVTLIGHPEEHPTQ